MAAPSDTSSAPSGLPTDYFTQRLSAELRVQIYELVLPNGLRLREIEEENADDYDDEVDISLLFVNKRVYHEARAILLSTNAFSVSYDHICMRGRCSHRCPCGSTPFDHKRLRGQDLRIIRDLTITEPRQVLRKDREICWPCLWAYSNCTPTLPILLQLISPLPKLQALTISCRDLADFSRTATVIRSWINSLKLQVDPRMFSYKVGEIEIQVAGKFNKLAIQLPELTAAWKFAIARDLHYKLNIDAENAIHENVPCKPIYDLLFEYKDFVHSTRIIDAAMLEFFEKNPAYPYRGTYLWLKNHPGGAERFARFNIAFTELLASQRWRKWPFYYATKSLGGDFPSWPEFMIEFNEGVWDEDHTEDPDMADGDSPPQDDGDW